MPCIEYLQLLSNALSERMSTRASLRAQRAHGQRQAGASARSTDVFRAALPVERAHSRAVHTGLRCVHSLARLSQNTCMAQRLVVCRGHDEIGNFPAMEGFVSPRFGLSSLLLGDGVLSRSLRVWALV